MKRTFSAEENAAATLVLGIASDTIRAFTHQTISRVTDDVAVLHGTWESELELPQRPVISVSTIKVDAVALTIGSWALTAGKLYRGRLPLVNGPDWDGPTVGHWGGPSSAIEVTYTHGWAVIPRDIVGLCLEMARRSAAVTDADGVKSETVGPDTITYVTFDSGAAGSLTRAEERFLVKAGYRR